MEKPKKYEKYERLIGFEGVLEFLELIGFEPDETGTKYIYNKDPNPMMVDNVVEVLDSYANKLAMQLPGHQRKPSGQHKPLPLTGQRGLPAPNRDSVKQPALPPQQQVQYLDPEIDNGSDGAESMMSATPSGIGSEDDNSSVATEIVSLEQIVMIGTHEKMRDPDVMDVLIMCHKTFSDSISLMNTLRQRFFVIVPEDVMEDDLRLKEFRTGIQKPIQLHVGKTVKGMCIFCVFFYVFFSHLISKRMDPQ